MREGWVIRKLEDICIIKNGRSQKAVVNPNGQYPIYGSGGIMGYADEYICEAGTTIIGRKGTINKPIFVDCAFWNVDTAFGLQPKATTNPRFLFYLCKSIDFARYNKSTTLPSLVKSDLLKIDVKVPPIQEQEKIVAELDCLSEVIAKKKQQLEELDNLSQSVFYDMFGDPISNDRKWRTECLAKKCSLKAGKSIKATELIPFPSGGRVPCYGGNGIRGYIEKQSHVGIFPIIGRQGALCGNVVLASGKFYATEHAVVVSPLSKDVNPIWLYYTLKCLNLNRFAQGVAQPGLAVKSLNTVGLIVPPLNLQDEFAQKIEALDGQEELLKRSIVETETLFNSRMDYWFN